MFKVKTITVDEGGGRAQLLDELESSLRNEKVTSGHYVVTIAKVPPDRRVVVKTQAVRKKKKKT